jgi:hypothetical protein
MIREKGKFEALFHSHVVTLVSPLHAYLYEIRREMDSHGVDNKLEKSCSVLARRISVFMRSSTTHSLGVEYGLANQVSGKQF